MVLFLYQDEVKEELLLADVILPSLDTVSSTIFQYLNRPHPSLDIEKIVRGLKDFRKSFRGQVWLEILFCRGVNDTREEIAKLKSVVNEINPDKIQLNSVDRPPAEDFVFSLNQKQILEIKKIFGDRSEIITESIDDKIERPVLNGEKRVVDLLRRRPCTFDGISLALGMHRNELVKLLDVLRKERKIHHRMFNNQCYYQVN